MPMVLDESVQQVHTCNSQVSTKFLPHGLVLVERCMALTEAGVVENNINIYLCIVYSLGHMLLFPS